MMNSAKIINYHHLVHHLYYNAKIPDKNIGKSEMSLWRKLLLNDMKFNYFG